MARPVSEGKSPFSLEHYHVSESFGFAIPDPLHKLPPYFQPWMDIAVRVPELVDSHELRSHVKKMPLLSSKTLQKHRELRLAHLSLSAMTMGYIWQEGENDLIETLPCTLAVPLWEVSQRLGFPPILTFADIALCNWRKRDPEGPFEVSNLELLIRLPGGESVRCFFSIVLMVDLAAAPALQNIPAVINGVRCGDTEAVARALDVISQSLQKMTETLKLLHVHVEPAVFFGILRLFLAGWKNNPCLPNGLVYEGVQTKPMEFSGANAAQSSPVHCLDELLGVKHEGHNLDFLTRMRNHMPPAHKKLIQDISLEPSLRRFVQQQDNEPLNEAFNTCLKTLLEFRNRHIIVVSRFIILPAAQARQLREQGKGVANGKAPALLEKVGTGGSDIMTFLKTVREETKHALLPEASN